MKLLKDWTMKNGRTHKSGKVVSGLSKGLIEELKKSGHLFDPNKKAEEKENKISTIKRK